MARRGTRFIPSPQLELAGALGLAFANTAVAGKDRRQLGFDDYAGLLVWGQRAGVLSTLEAERLAQVAARAKRKAATAYKHSLALRARTTSLFAAAIAGQPPPPGELEAFNRALASGMPAVRLAHGEDGYCWGWAGDEEHLERMLWPVAHSAAEVLTGAERQRLGRCLRCGLFFLNRTARRRKWCDMKVCGNRAKALSYYHRRGKHSAVREAYIMMRKIHPNL